MIDGIDLHHYMLTGTWEKKGQATVFTEAEWAELMQQATGFDELITRHAAIMDRSDPKKRVWLIVGEWGTWHQVEPGTNPGFLYQQNSLRDALVASVSFDAFNKHAARVKMANIAQTVNVLQAMILTQKQQMLLTPTYHVFEFYTVHQDAVLLPIALDAGRYVHGERTMPAVSATASRDTNGRIHLTLTNVDPNQPDHQRLGAGPVSHGCLRPDPHGDPDERAQHVRAAPSGASGAVHRRNCRRWDAHGAAAREVSRSARAAVRLPGGRTPRPPRICRSRSGPGPRLRREPDGDQVDRGTEGCRPRETHSIPYSPVGGGVATSNRVKTVRLATRRTLAGPTVVITIHLSGLRRASPSASVSVGCITTVSPSNNPSSTCVRELPDSFNPREPRVVSARAPERDTVPRPQWRSAHVSRGRSRQQSRRAEHNQAERHVHHHPGGRRSIAQGTGFRPFGTRRRTRIWSTSRRLSPRM